MRFPIGRDVLMEVLSLYGAQGAYTGLALMTVPYLTRVLGPASWGVLAFAQTLSQFGALIIDYGFSYSAARSVSVAVEDTKRLSQIRDEVFGAKAALAALVSVGMLVSWRGFGDDHAPLTVAGSILWAWAQGFSMVWFFQGVRRLRALMLIEVPAKAAAAIATLVFVRHPGDVSVYFLIQAVCSSAALAIEVGLMQRMVRHSFQVPKYSRLSATLREGWHLFLVRGSVSLYTLASSTLLGFISTATQLAYYSSAEKLLRLGHMCAQPVYQAFFPRVCARVSRSNEDLGLAVSRFLIITTILSMVFSIAMIPVGRWVCVVLFGRAFEPAGSVLAVLAWALPFGTVTSVLGTLWLIPHGLDSTYSRATMAAGLVNITGCLLLGPRFHAKGVAVSVVLSELVVSLWIIAALKRRAFLPWAAGPRPVSRSDEPVLTHSR
jgi:polysaccharide transporter, PST family